MTRTSRWYAQSIHAFCNWLIAEQFIEEKPVKRKGGRGKKPKFD